MSLRQPDKSNRGAVAVTDRGDLTVLEVATDFGVVEEMIHQWMRQADLDEGIKDGMTSAVKSGLVRLRRDRCRLNLEDEI